MTTVSSSDGHIFVQDICSIETGIQDSELLLHVTKTRLDESTPTFTLRVNRHIGANEAKFHKLVSEMSSEFAFDRMVSLGIKTDDIETRVKFLSKNYEMYFTFLGATWSN